MSEARQLWVLAGGREWARARAQTYLAEHALWLGEPPEGVVGGPAREAFKWLGRELDLLVMDAWAGFDVEAFAAATGALRGGGLLLLLTPALHEWPEFADPEYARIAVYPYTAAQIKGRFLQRFVRLLGQHEIAVFTQSDSLPSWRPTAFRRLSGWCSKDQLGALAAIDALMHSTAAHKALVLTADRGRGKSAVLGMAAARLLVQQGRSIIVTAPRRAAVATLFKHAAIALPQARYQVGRLCLATHAGSEICLQFMPPDGLLQSLPAAGLLLVDEAAAIPSPLLEKLLTHYPACIFATTLHGYEGTGQGFAVRFQKILQASIPDWQSLHLHEPIRWAADDPLEHFVFAALLLAAQAADDQQVSTARAEDCQLERIERDALLADESQLQQLFGLLILAHYRTSPLDLRHLLDGPNVSLWRACWRGQVVATALTVREGGFATELAGEIYRGERRPRGHLIPQSLALHSGFVEAAQLSGERIMRIAVHPCVQGRGLGTRLVEAIVAQALADELDFVGASFSATTELLDFWQKVEFLPMRLGLKRDASSGTHSVIVLRPLSAPGKPLLARIRARFLAQLPGLQREMVKTLPVDLAAGLQTEAQVEQNPELDAQDWRDVESFVRGWRGYEVCQLALAKLVRQKIGQLLVDKKHKELLQRKVLHQQGWPEVIAALGYRGHAEALAELRQAMAELC